MARPAPPVDFGAVARAIDANITRTLSRPRIKLPLLPNLEKFYYIQPSKPVVVDILEEEAAESESQEEPVYAPPPTPISPASPAPVEPPPPVVEPETDEVDVNVEDDSTPAVIVKSPPQQLPVFVEHKDAASSTDPPTPSPPTVQLENDQTPIELPTTFMAATQFTVSGLDDSAPSLPTNIISYSEPTRVCKRTGLVVSRDLVDSDDDEGGSGSGEQDESDADVEARYLRTYGSVGFVAPHSLEDIDAMQTETLYMRSPSDFHSEPENLLAEPSLAASLEEHQVPLPSLDFQVFFLDSETEIPATPCMVPPTPVTHPVAPPTPIQASDPIPSPRKAVKRTAAEALDTDPDSPVEVARVVIPALPPFLDQPSRMAMDYIHMPVLNQPPTQPPAPKRRKRDRIPLFSDIAPFPTTQNHVQFCVAPTPSKPKKQSFSQCNPQPKASQSTGRFKVPKEFTQHFKINPKAPRNRSRQTREVMPDGDV